MEKLSYALGMIIGQNLKNMGVADLRNERFAKAVEDVIKGNAPEMTGAEANKLVSEFMQKEEARAGEAVRTAGENFLKENAGKEGVVVLPSGLQYKVLKEGNDRMPGATSQVRCHYEGKFINGQVFDSSYKRGEPAVFGLNQVIAGWTEGLQLMGEGGVCELYIPYNLAYGETGSNGAIPPCATLIFKVELLEVL